MTSLLLSIWRVVSTARYASNSIRSRRIFRRFTLCVVDDDIERFSRRCVVYGVSVTIPRFIRSMRLLNRSWKYTRTILCFPTGDRLIFMLLRSKVRSR